MYIKIDDVKNHCEIWVPYEERLCYKEMSQYISALEYAKQFQYSVCIYLGGQSPLLPNMMSLLEQQTIQKIS